MIPFNGANMTIYRFRVIVSAGASVVCSMLVLELLGLNRHIRGFVQIHFWELELVLGITLWAQLLILILRRKGRSPIRLLPLLGFGLIAGLISGVIAAASLSILNYHEHGMFYYTLSWKDLASFAGLAAVATLGWLVGLLSGCILYCLHNWLAMSRPEQI